MAKSYLIEFFKKRLLHVIILGAVAAIAVMLAFSRFLAVNYIVGTLLGIMNFVLLTVGLELILSFKPLTARFAHFVFWALRYAAIAAFIVYYYLYKDANLLAVVGGLLTMHISIFMDEMTKHLFLGKEG